MKEALIIFAKNPIKGIVKTRLAATIGDDKALAVYQMLLEQTAKITTQITQEKKIYFTHHKEENNLWKNHNQHLQPNGKLGERMASVFNTIFDSNYDNLVIIGTDCYELTTSIIEKAFQQLNHYDVVIGPAKDGGYYLLGMKSMHSDLFENKAWSTDTVFIDTIEDLKRLNLSHYSLPTLSDLDTEEDLKELQITLIEE